MQQAWQRRESERQQALEELLRKAYRVQDEHDFDDDFYLQVAILLIGFLQHMRGGRIADEESIISDFVVDCTSAIDVEFARAPEEARVMVASLAKKFLQTGTNGFFSSLQRLEHENPQLIYKADSATVEVSLNGDTPPRRTL